MGIGKGKSDKIDIDGLIEGVGNENKVAQEESKLEQKIKELKDTFRIGSRYPQNGRSYFCAQNSYG